jgi:hypothetical protein
LVNSIATSTKVSQMTLVEPLPADLSALNGGFPMVASNFISSGHSTTNWIKGQAC